MSFYQPSEFLCSCGRPECDAPKAVTPALLSKLDALRYYLDRPVVITSGLRCAYWNKKQGGVADSEHLTGEAADILVENSTELFKCIEANFHGLKPLFHRIGIKNRMLHCGISETHAQEVCWLYPQQEYPKHEEEHHA